MSAKSIVKCVFGSHLYGTNTEHSDRDFKAVHLPCSEDLLLARAVKSISKNTKNGEGKNTALDEDFESYSLQYFIMTMGRNGDTTFLDMIHAPDSALLETSEEWEFIRQHKTKFYTKTLKSYLGYARKHASSFTNSSAKMEASETLLSLLKTYPKETKLAEVYDILPESSFSKKYKIENSEAKDKRTYDFCGKKFMASSNISFILESLEQTHGEYGQRTRDALECGGVNVKSLSHAFRVGFQLRDLYSEGIITFPLKEADWLRSMKLRELDFKKDGLSDRLEDLLTEVEDLAAKSDFPQQVAMSFWEEWLVDLYN